MNAPILLAPVPGLFYCCGMAEEIWRAIPGTDYEASSLGRIRRSVPDSCGRKPRVLAQAINSTGRAQVSICSGRKARSEKVHRLVTLAFHGEPGNPKAMACHRDGDPLHNRPGNLYWGTAKTNGADAARHGTTCPGTRNGNSKLTEEQARRIKADARSSSIISQEMGIHSATVCRIRRGETWKHLA